MFRALTSSSSFSLSTRCFVRNGSAPSLLRAQQATFSSSSLRRANEPAARSATKDPSPQRSRGGDEEGIKTDDVAATDAAFEPGLSSKEAAEGIEKETGDSLQSSPANPKASKPKGPQQGVSDATDDAKK